MDFKFGRYVNTFTGSIRTKAHLKFWRKGSVVCIWYASRDSPLLSQEWVNLWTSNFISTLIGSEQKPIKNFGNSSRGRSQELSKISRAPIYRAHREVIFAIAQLSCAKRLWHLFASPLLRQTRTYFCHVTLYRRDLLFMLRQLASWLTVCHICSSQSCYVSKRPTFQWTYFTTSNATILVYTQMTKFRWGLRRPNPGNPGAPSLCHISLHVQCTDQELIACG